MTLTEGTPLLTTLSQTINSASGTLFLQRYSGYTGQRLFLSGCIGGGVILGLPILVPTLPAFGLIKYGFNTGDPFGGIISGTGVGGLLWYLTWNPLSNRIWSASVAEPVTLTAVFMAIMGGALWCAKPHTSTRMHSQAIYV